MLELKRSTISVTEGIRQNLDNQKRDFIRPFFATVQLMMAGNDTEGLRYAVIGTREKYWLQWKEESPLTNPLQHGLEQLCRRDRLLEIIHDFIVFDAGTRKTCRHNQYFGVRAAQQHVKRREGGIIWHTQGSGKSLTMVWLAKWIREHVEEARVLIITDRSDLDEQIEKVFRGVDEAIYRTKSGADLVNVLNAGEEWLVCSLIHKFGASEEGNIDAYLKEIEAHLPKGFHAKGDIFVFVDECHRTQSGKLHEAMKAILPGAMLMGFTGTPLLKKDKQADLKGKCAIITSYKPAPADIKGKETGEGLTEKLRQYDVYRKMLAEHFNEPEETAMYKVEQFEKDVKKRFIDQPGPMKLLIVVDKLLTGFDAPPATYLYIDRQMQDHGLFQAICRVNRLDGDDKEYGYIVDYKDLFKSLEKSVKDYTSEAFDGFDEEDVAGLLKDRLEKGRERLEELREAIKALCEPVPPPRDQEAYLRFFCGTSDQPESLKENEPKRVALYKLTSSLIRAYANLANEMQEAGYSDSEAQEIEAEVGHFEKLRQEVKLRSGDYIDMKVFEPAMRHLLDTYIRAEESEKVSAFDDMSLVELIVQRGEHALDLLPKGITDNQDSMAETIENNVRKVIIDEMAVNPKYYEKMSELLVESIFEIVKEPKNGY